MKKALTFILALALCMSLAVPALAAPAASTTTSTTTGTYGPITVLDGTSVITFSQARVESRAIMLSREAWYEGSSAAVVSESMRTDINLIVLKSGSTVTRTAGLSPMNLSFLSKSGSGYLLRADRVSTYSTSFAAAQLFAYPFVVGDICQLTVADGSVYYLIPDTAALVEAPPVPISYIVQSGDTLDAIALNYYGVQGLGTYLYKANPEHFAATNGILEAGRPLTLPVQLNGNPRLSAPLATEGELIYFVKAGDSLSTIAKRFYGRSDFSNYIYQRNSSRISNPGLIQVGQLIVLPVVHTN